MAISKIGLCMDPINRCIDICIWGHWSWHQLPRLTCVLISVYRYIDLEIFFYDWFLKLIIDTYTYFKDPKEDLSDIKAMYALAEKNYGNARNKTEKIILMGDLVYLLAKKEERKKSDFFNGIVHGESEYKVTPY